jgi:hypothetical protein
MTLFENYSLVSETNRDVGATNLAKNLTRVNGIRDWTLQLRSAIQ